MEYIQDVSEYYRQHFGDYRTDQLRILGKGHYVRNRLGLTGWNVKLGPGAGITTALYIYDTPVCVILFHPV
jgi:hypothetical protein